MLKSKHAIFLSTLLISGFLITGCGNQAQQTSSDAQKPQVSTNSNASNTNNGNNQKPDMIGEVTSVTEIKLLWN